LSRLSEASCKISAYSIAIQEQYRDQRLQPILRREATRMSLQSKLRIVSQGATPMQESTKSVQSLEELRGYIADTLSSFESLKSDQLRLSQQILYRGERPCGILSARPAHAAAQRHLGNRSQQRSVLWIVRTADAAH
jgi:hypothetical protein